MPTPNTHTFKVRRGIFGRTNTPSWFSKEKEKKKKRKKCSSRASGAHHQWFAEDIKLCSQLLLVVHRLLPQTGSHWPNESAGMPSAVCATRQGRGARDRSEDHQAFNSTGITNSKGRPTETDQGVCGTKGSASVKSEGPLVFHADSVLENR